MIQINDKHNCCGCNACGEICSKDAISFKTDQEGFWYPEVDMQKCVDCGLCEKVCPVINQNVPQTPIHIMAAINMDERTREQSSSGGVFSLLAEHIISEGGVVFGAKFDDKWQVIITEAETIQQIAAFRGSKYLQASTGNSYKRCKMFLDSGRKVLYSGTPCQIAGLLRFLRKPYTNLITVDFICHGVPSPGVWNRYLGEVVAAGKQAVKDISFRNKKRGWKRFSFMLNYDSHNKNFVLLSSLDKNIYMRAFLSNLILRPSCHECPVKCGKSHSDITIGDFWGIQDFIPTMDDDKGTSLVMINSLIGEKLIPFNKIRYEYTNMDVLRNNSAYYRSAKQHPMREIFFTSFSNNPDLHQVLESILRLSFKEQVKCMIKESLSLLKTIKHKLSFAGDWFIAPRGKRIGGGGGL